MVSSSNQARKLEIVSQEHNEDERSKETSSPKSNEISPNLNQQRDSFLDIMTTTEDNEIINIENETVNSSPPPPSTALTSAQQQQSCSQNNDNPTSLLNIHTSQNIQPTQGPTPAVTPTQKLSPRLQSISEQKIAQTRPELRSLLYSSHQLPLQQQQYLEHTFADQYQLQQVIQSLGQMVPVNYCSQDQQQFQLLTDCGQVIHQQIGQPSTSFLQSYQPQSSHSQNVHSVLRHQHNFQRKSQPISESERQKRRLERNRVAARQCRERKKVYVSSLESKVTRLEEENAKLRCEILELNAKLLQNPVDIQENERLYFLTEELKARLYGQQQQSNQSSQHPLQQQQKQQQQQQQQQQSVNKESNSLSSEDVIVKDEL